jgi:hypothetical protein
MRSSELQSGIGILPMKPHNHRLEADATFPPHPIRAIREIRG